MAKIFAPLAFIGLLALCACNNKEVERLKFENDSLRAELLVKADMEAVMSDVRILLDSIDLGQEGLRKDMGEGLANDDYTGRLRNIKDYVSSTEERIAKFEKQLKASNRNANSYMKMLNALRSEFALRMEEVASLETEVLAYKQENAGLISQVKTQQKEIEDIKQTSTAEITKRDTKLKEAEDAARHREADAYYTQARTVEETANRTRLAPKKKKETYREALELYKKAYSLGKSEAQEDITKLESKLK